MSEDDEDRDSYYSDDRNNDNRFRDMDYRTNRGRGYEGHLRGK